MEREKHRTIVLSSYINIHMFHRTNSQMSAILVLLLLGILSSITGLCAPLSLFYCFIKYCWVCKCKFNNSSIEYKILLFFKENSSKGISL